MATRKQKEIEARKAADPLAQAMERDDIDYTSDELPSAPRYPIITTPALPDSVVALLNEIPHCQDPECGFCKEGRVATDLALARKIIERVIREAGGWASAPGEDGVAQLERDVVALLQATRQMRVRCILLYIGFAIVGAVLVLELLGFSVVGYIFVKGRK